MENSKSIVESTLLQIKAVEDAISENAKGILASTMKEEISELVRESLGSKKRRIREQEENEPEVDAEVDAESVTLFDLEWSKREKISTPKVPSSSSFLFSSNSILLLVCAWITVSSI